MERKKRNRKYKGSSSAPNSGANFDVNLEYEFANVRQLAGKGIYSDHISNHPQRSSSVTLRGGWTEVKTIYESLPPVVQERVRRYPWRHIYLINPRNHRTQGVQVIFERWWQTTNTFFFKNFECGKFIFSPVICLFKIIILV